jgi:hypothetical protein
MKLKSLEEDFPLLFFINFINRINEGGLNVSSLNELRIPKGRILKVSGLIILVINIYHSKSDSVSIIPFKVVH